MLVNFLYVASYPWLRHRRLGVVIAGSALGLLFVAAVAGNLDGGFRYPTADQGLLRTLFSFFSGVAMCRAHRAGRWPAPRVPAIVLIAIATAALLIEVPDRALPVYDPFCVLLLFPLLVWCAVHVEPRRGVAACTTLG